jgi:hypothetical protein
MAVQATIGQASALDGRDACIQAVRDALLGVDSAANSIAFVFASHEYDPQAVLMGARSQLGNAAMIGLSTTGEITKEGSQNRSVTVALLTGKEIQAKADWLPASPEQNEQALKDLINNLAGDIQPDDANLMLVADGLNAEGGRSFDGLSIGEGAIFGCLAGADLPNGVTTQFGGSKAGTGGIASALISGVKIGVGVAHGWQPTGASFEITLAEDHLLRTLDGQPASESYARLLGYEAHEWGLPPLNTLVRLYPLGIDSDNGSPIDVISPMWVEADGSLRMNAAVKDGRVGHLLVGSREKCVDAARLATFEALSSFGSGKVALVLIFADVSWKMLLEGQPGSEVQAVREIIGRDTPIAGGYTFGQIVRHAESDEVNFLSQHIEVVVIGEADTE